MASVPFDQLDGFIWMNGEFVNWADAKVHVLTHGLHYASAVFEGERAYGGEIFKLTEHTERLHESARILGFKIPYSRRGIDDACRTLLKKQGFKDAYVRPIAWRGSEQMGVSAQNNRINVAIAIWQWPSYFDPAQKLKGIRLDIAEYRRPDPRTAPSKSKAAGLYMICTISKHAAEAKGYADALMLDWRGQVAEATGANMFFVKDGKSSTRRSPTASSTASRAARSSISPSAAASRSSSGSIMPEELEGFEQCFLTGTAAEVTPVSEIGPVQVHGRQDRRDADERLFGRSAAEARDRRRIREFARFDGIAGRLRGRPFPFRHLCI